MTIICKGAATKKELATRAKLCNAGQLYTTVTFVDPAIVAPIHNGQPFGFNGISNGEKFICTNHPKRSWFAEVGRKADGQLYVK